MRNKYVRTRGWVAGGVAALFVGLVGVLFTRDQQATANADDAPMAETTINTTLPFPTPAAQTQTRRRLPGSDLPPQTQQQSPSTRTAPSQTQPSTTQSAPHTRTRAS